MRRRGWGVTIWKAVGIVCRRRFCCIHQKANEVVRQIACDINVESTKAFDETRGKNWQLDDYNIGGKARLSVRSVQRQIRGRWATAIKLPGLTFLRRADLTAVFCPVFAGGSFCSVRTAPAWPLVALLARRLRNKENCKRTTVSPHTYTPCC